MPNFSTQKDRDQIVAQKKATVTPPHSHENTWRQMTKNDGVTNVPTISATRFKSN